MKTIKSPSKKWPGEVVLSDPLTFPQVLKLEEALREAQAAGDNISMTRMNYLLLPGILACVERFNLDGFPETVTADTFPATPRVASAELIAWLINEVMDLYRNAVEIPNE